MLGQLVVEVKYQEQSAQLTLLVAKGEGPTLLGRDWLQVISVWTGKLLVKSSKARCMILDQNVPARA